MRTLTLTIALAVVSIVTASLVAVSRGATAQESEDYWLGIREVICEDAGVDAFFAIPPLLDAAFATRLRLPGPAAETWVDLSLFDNGFAPGTFIGNGPHPASAESDIVQWSGLRAGTMHYYRLNIRVGSQWYQRSFDSFETPDCNVVLRIMCDDESSRAYVTFRVPGPGILEGGAPVETWLDLSLRGTGFPPGTYVGAGPFPANPPFAEPGGTLFEWRDVNIASRHYWRTNTLFQPFGWLMQRAGTFRSLGCNTLLRTA